MDLKQMSEEMKEHLLKDIIPFWRGLRDDEFGGYYGWLSYDLELNKKAPKGCILNSRITWFFSNVCLLYKNGLLTDGDFEKYGYKYSDVLSEAGHAFRFLFDKCIDRENGGIFWSLKYDGTPDDTTKHTYNQAFCIYALSSYFDVTGDESAIKLARELIDIIETKCADEGGYLEARTITFEPESNEKLSENGVMADRTMNTLLHVFEAYSEYFRVTGDARVGERLRWIMDTFAEKMYNPALHRQEVFFDADYNTLIDLYSYGHDIETAWLMDRGVKILGSKEYEDKMYPITKDFTANVYKVAFDGHSLANECERGVVNEGRVWWVQAESVLGFLNGYLADKSHKEYFEAAVSEWEFIKDFVIDKRKGSEWFALVDKKGKPDESKPIVEPWKCPYHNGRMCMEVIKRAAGIYI
ncbi:MAG: AGE family epimerase/isomerase [Lachnospiraceae bacterium]|nr:AGE family epimerase/isomerase [Lachnospiraceae bacterium]